MPRMDSGLENGRDETSRRISTVELNPIPPIFHFFFKTTDSKMFLFHHISPVTPLCYTTGNCNSSLMRASPKIGLIRWIVRAEAGILQGRGRLQGACYKEIVLWWKWKETHVYRWWVFRPTSLYWKCWIKILFMAISPFSTSAPPQLKKKGWSCTLLQPSTSHNLKTSSETKKSGFTKWDPDPVSLSMVTTPLVEVNISPQLPIYFWSIYRGPITPFVTSRGPLCRERHIKILSRFPYWKQHICLLWVIQL